MAKRVTARWLGLSGLAVFWLGACGDGEPSLFPTDPDAAGATVTVKGGDTTVGFARGKLRRVESVKAFSIMKHPVTVKQYKKCQKAGACKEPRLDECSSPDLARQAMKGDGDNVALCVGYDNAQRFCKWVEGRLPTLPEWLRAARGPEVQEHPWGKDPASCEEHARAVVIDGTGMEQTRSSCPELAEKRFATRHHPQGASAAGLEDILISPSELVEGSERALFGACANKQLCLVYGRNPGAIDAVRPFAQLIPTSPKDEDSSSLKLVPMTYGVRCAFAD